MSSMLGHVAVATVTYTVGTVLYPLRKRYRRSMVEAIAQGTIRATPQGDGALRTHRVGRMFDFMAICGQPVSSIGGPGSGATCRACQRIYSQGMKEKGNL